MAVQEFDRPVRRLRESFELYVSVALLILTVGFIGYTVMNLPAPANDRPLASRPVSDIPR